MDFKLRYEIDGYANRHSTTRIRSWVHGSGIERFRIILATEQSDNEGPSITNSAEWLWPKAIEAVYSREVQVHITHPGYPQILIEHYKPLIERGHTNPLGSFDRVTFVDENPTWAPIALNEFIGLTGKTMEEINNG
jgi:hypothetical protein